MQQLKMFASFEQFRSTSMIQMIRKMACQNEDTIGWIGFLAHNWDQSEDPPAESKNEISSICWILKVMFLFARWLENKYFYKIKIVTVLHKSEFVFGYAFPTIPKYAMVSHFVGLKGKIP